MIRPSSMLLSVSLLVALAPSAQAETKTLVCTWSDRTVSFNLQVDLSARSVLYAGHTYGALVSDTEIQWSYIEPTAPPPGTVNFTLNRISGQLKEDYDYGSWSGSNGHYTNNSGTSYAQCHAGTPVL